MIYGYLRVSSDEQDVNSQKQGVEQFAKDKGWTIDKYITDEGVSGGDYAVCASTGYVVIGKAYACDGFAFKKLLIKKFENGRRIIQTPKS